MAHEGNLCEMSDEYTVLVCGPFVNRRMWNNFTPENLVLYSLIKVVNSLFSVQYSLGFKVGPELFQKS